MTDRDEFVDDRGDWEFRSSPGGPHLLYSQGWHASVRDIDDAPVDPGVLGRVVPLDGRWPEPRLLQQTAVFYLRDRTRLHPAGFDAETAAWLLDELHTDLPDWHAAAAFDEEATMSSVTRDALAALGVPAIRDLNPQAWLESTVLFRFLDLRSRLRP